MHNETKLRDEAHLLLYNSILEYTFRKPISHIEAFF